MAVDAGTAGRAVKSSLRRPALAGMLIVVVLAALATYLGVLAHRAHQTDAQRNLLLRAARQTAVDMTTIDWEHADSDIARILASATGHFHDDYSQRSKPFVDVVERTRSKSVGTVTAAGMESYSGNQAQVLVCVSVTTTEPGAPQANPRNWRMRISVEMVGGDAKVADVRFL